jgi:hypothetical protein
MAAPVTGGNRCHSRPNTRGSLRKSLYGCQQWGWAVGADVMPGTAGQQRPALGSFDGTGTGTARSKGVKVTRDRLAWVRRVSFAAVLVVAAITPGQASSGSLVQCQNDLCVTAGTVRWAQPLPGSWVAQNGMTGTTPEQGQAYAALGSDVAAVGLGTTVAAYAAGTGEPLWTTDLAGFEPGAAIISVRVWPGVVTVGVALPAAAGAGTGSAAGPVRDEVVLRAATGRLVRVYPAAQFGGAVAASGARTVIVGQHSVTSYANRTGKVLWSRPTGEVPQAWQVDGNHLYMIMAAGDQSGATPVTVLRRPANPRGKDVRHTA